MVEETKLKMKIRQIKPFIGFVSDDDNENRWIANYNRHICTNYDNILCGIVRRVYEAENGDIYEEDNEDYERLREDVDELMENGEWVFPTKIYYGETDGRIYVTGYGGNGQ